jgi:AcrR family transcriptional regulator
MSAPHASPQPASARRRTSTRTRLISAGLDLLAHRPIDSLTIDDIVLAAGTAKGSFYNHFEHRAAFAAAVAEYVREKIEARISFANEGVLDPAERMVRAMGVLVNFALTDPSDAATMVRSHEPATRVSHSINRGLKYDLESGLATGRFFAITADSAALFVLGVNYITLLRLVTESTQLRGARAIARQSGLHLLLGLGVSRRDAQKLASEAATALVTGCAPQSLPENSQ